MRSNNSNERSAIQKGSVQCTVAAIHNNCLLFTTGVVSALSTHSGLSPTVSLVRQFTVALVFLNSTLNPILYCCKLREVRQAVKETFEQILFSPSSSV